MIFCKAPDSPEKRASVAYGFNDHSVSLQPRRNDHVAGLHAQPDDLSLGDIRIASTLEERVVKGQISANIRGGQRPRKDSIAEESCDIRCAVPSRVHQPG